MNMPVLLIVDDEKPTRDALRMGFQDDYEVYTASNLSQAVTLMREESPDLVLTDLRLGGENGMDVLKSAAALSHPPQSIMMTAYGSVDAAVEAMKQGAYDFVTKPLNLDAVEMVLKRALHTRNLETANQELTSRIQADSGLQKLLGRSTAMEHVFSMIRQVAPSKTTVLIEGESGTGKELVAQAIHSLSGRPENKFVAVNCAALSPQLLESELFGHEKGSFTGAAQRRIGRFEQADGGTIFLDEIGNLSYEVQIQLLRALQERKIRPVGSTQEISVDIRLVSATNENLEQGIETGTFREDLYHRINEFTLRMPDLKERKEDILLFANFFLDQANKELDKHLIGFDAKASQALLNYHWPGNLRQMKNIVKRATLLAQSSFITLLELGTELLETPASSNTSIALRNEETEKEHILEALRQTGNNKSKAAQLLNIDRKTLYNKLKLYNIDL